ncbi:MAG: hypothetical protein M5U34_18650 [Chloroflexi bacterium]|nr:hypothetical protein [Chloroflexota bacterium]
MARVYNYFIFFSAYLFLPGAAPFYAAENSMLLASPSFWFLCCCLSSYIPFVVIARALPVALIGLLIITGISIQTLPDKRANRFIILGSLAGITTILINLMDTFLNALLSSTVPCLYMY